MRNKMITLCPTSYELAQKMPNFSAWVRQKVLQHQTNVVSNKPDRELMHSECGNFSLATWKPLIDGTFAYVADCECGSLVTWRVN
jgi:hypothetical protein